MDKDTEKTVNTGEKVDTKFKKGDDPRRNLEGRPKGTNNFTTDFNEVIEEIAKENHLTKSAVRKILLKRAYGEAKNGNFPFWHDIADRYYGKPKEVREIKGTIMIAQILDEADKEADKE